MLIDITATLIAGFIVLIAASLTPEKDKTGFMAVCGIVGFLVLIFVVGLILSAMRTSSGPSF